MREMTGVGECEPRGSAAVLCALVWPLHWVLGALEPCIHMEPCMHMEPGMHMEPCMPYGYSTYWRERTHSWCSRSGCRAGPGGETCGAVVIWQAAMLEVWGSAVSGRRAGVVCCSQA